MERRFKVLLRLGLSLVIGAGSLWAVKAVTGVEIWPKEVREVGESLVVVLHLDPSSRRPWSIGIWK